MPENVTVTDAALAEIEARAKAVRFIDGPWLAKGYTIYDPHGMTVCERVRDPEHADFIAHARSDVPDLIAALRASRERARRYEAALRLWLQGLNMMRTLSVHDPSQAAVVEMLTKAESDARAALGEEAT